MKKKFIDKSLLVEGLSQLRLPGFVFLIISILGSVLPAVFSAISYHSLCSQYGVTSSNAQSAATVSIQGVAGILLPIIYLAPFAFCLVLFSFLNNRKGSDYYHSLSFTRVNVFLSFAASVLIWLALIVASSILAASFVYTVSGMIFNATFIPYLLFTFFAGTVLVMACMLFAMSITGTVLSNTVVFGLILFLPRFIAFLSMQSIFSALPILSSNSGGLANVSNNIPVNLIFHYFFNSYGSSASIYTSISAIVYTLVLAVIYIAVACLLFHFRKSEAAGSSAPNRALQHVFRCTVTLPVALCIPLMLASLSAASGGRSRISFLMSSAPTLITIAVISIFIYFLYELLTTRSLKKMIRSAPMLLAVVAVCTVFGLSINIAKSIALSFTPSSSEIESITMLPVNGNNYISNGTSTAKYNELVLKNLELRDDSLKYAIAITLGKNVDTLKAGNSVYSNNYTNYHVGIRLKSGKYVERILYASSSQSSDILKCLHSDATFVKNSILLPPESSIKQIYTNDLSEQKSVKKLWNSFKAEFVTLSESDKLLITQSTAYITTYSSFTVEGSVGVDSYDNIYPVSSKTPKTVALYVKMINAKNKATAKSLLSSYITGDKSCDNYSITLLNGIDDASQKYAYTGTLADYYNGSSDSKDTVSKESKCFKILLKQIDDIIDINKPFAQVSMSSGNKSYVYYQALSSSNDKAIKRLNITSKG